MNLILIGSLLLAALGGLVFLNLVATETELLDRALQVRQKLWKRKLNRDEARQTSGEPVEAAVYSGRNTPGANPRTSRRDNAR